ncbi:TMEM175 family protein [Lactococcus lactis]|nr:TMEM175 family protein [Lactococcus lactis]MDR7696892.1 TMEM175 family protein [Lactococcus lactis]
MSKTRLEAFTDAVIAIIMTVLVLELVRPDSDSLQSFIALLPHLGVYFVVFLYWLFTGSITIIFFKASKELMEKFYG